MQNATTAASLDQPRRGGEHLLVGAAVAALGLLMVLLGYGVRAGALDAFDVGVLKWLEGHRSPPATRFFHSMTALGSFEALALLGLGAVGALAVAGQRRMAVTFAVALAGAPLLSRGLKLLYGRARPSLVEALVGADAWSFPSGHTVLATVFFVTAALLVTGHVRRRGLRAFLFGYALVMGVLVALSRMYLGVHYPSDVLGGALVGLAWTLLVVGVERVVARRRVAVPVRAA